MLLCNPTVNYHVHKTPILVVHILSYIDPLHTLYGLNYFFLDKT
jgi:hypothetical protein